MFKGCWCLNSKEGDGVVFCFDQFKQYQNNGQGTLGLSRESRPRAEVCLFFKLVSCSWAVFSWIQMANWLHHPSSQDCRKLCSRWLGVYFGSTDLFFSTSSSFLFCPLSLEAAKWRSAVEAAFGSSLFLCHWGICWVIDCCWPWSSGLWGCWSGISSICSGEDCDKPFNEYRYQRICFVHFDQVISPVPSSVCLYQNHYRLLFLPSSMWAATESHRVLCSVY